MRWEIIKQAWALAGKKFPKTKRLFVDLPDQFRGAGECNIYDLDEPEKLLGKIVYEAVCREGNPVLSMKLDESEVTASLPKFEGLEFKTASSIQSLQQKNVIKGAVIAAKYTDPVQLGEQAAYLIVGHEDGLKFENNELHEGVIASWLDDHGFPAEIGPHVETKLASLGVSIARKKKRLFQNFEKVRVVDPSLREYNEGAQVIKHMRDKDKHNWYQIIVDGSDTPIWIKEIQLAKNEVGSILNVSSLDEGPK